MRHVYNAITGINEEFPDLPVIPIDEPPVIPQLVTNYQGKVALDYWQLLDEVEAYMDLESTPKQYKLAWATGAFERNSALLLGIATLFNLTDEQLDQMFQYAATVQ